MLGALALLCGHLVVALIALVVIGGVTRVMEAGLACPDWPLCYGSLLPGRQMNLQVFLEWFHRLDAFVVGVALLVLGAVSWLQRRRLPGWLPWAATVALALVAVQGALGALTVTHLLEASTVTAHLATALALVFGMAALHQALLGALDPQALPLLSLPWKLAALLAGLLVPAQCLLGGAMASRWAAERCFAAGESCRWLLLHRLGAWPAALSLLVLAALSLGLPAPQAPLRRLSLVALLLVAAQVALGILSLRLQLSQPAVTAAHQLVAALLVALIGALWGRGLLRPSAPQLTSLAPSPSFLSEALRG
ncbi:COX15/CtaA family protein [Cyanobium sp. FGCU-52]|nr:COX15/CtaA family protein [Cyanobium sp. FGCU52]